MNHHLHLGLGNFFRAHQAWYTGADPRWSITAFTGRSPDLADELTRRDCRYNLVVRGPSEDRTEPQTAITTALPGTDLTAWRSWMSRPSVAVLTLTVTEAAYADFVPARLVAGLAARRAAGAGSIAIIPCDNIPANGSTTAQAVAALADPALATWITDNVSFVSTMVDRITPRNPTPGVDVITEPFTEWILSGTFPAGRPTWEAAGARFVTDVRPHETRKLFLLNGAHTLLAYAGSALGHTTVASAVADPTCRTWLNEWWDEASRHVPLPAPELLTYRAALLTRFANPRIHHTLAQIATDGSQKLPIRVLPVLRAERSAGRMPTAALRIVSAWINHLRGAGAPLNDPAAAPYLQRAASSRDILTLLAPDLTHDEALLKALP
ncbi:mannitol dehydrogenase family protein [Winogradskya consettensis]|uniref:Mannitol-1-phosphate 5-dehydrogenase n=1 Tax=Winogradskya consettensis TaxID=113560 RepID=A0A919SZL9_9ACTN|nr:mannitol dehydrogenase family protein [Actinoplanes consettensis]GIM82330.1 mannitol-1-phosphate 5-dehydrogenase [Actinoplanes consettensis]